MRRWVMPTLAALVLAGTALPAASAGGGAGARRPMVRVWIRADAAADQAALKAQYGVRHDFGAAGHTVDLPAAALAALQERAGVTATPVPQRQVTAPPPGKGRGPGGGGRSAVPADRTPWGVETALNDSDISATAGGAGIKVAILDTGVAPHLDLAAPAQCVDFSANQAPVIAGTCGDSSGHGTHVAGTIAANGGSDGQGIYGVAPDAAYFAYRVCGRSGFCYADDVARAIIYAADNGAHIISMSLSGSTATELERDAVAYAAGRGVLIIASAGNNGPAAGSIGYPAALPGVVAVSALELVDPGTSDRSPANLRVTSFSSRGTTDGNDRTIADGEVEVAAPGRDVESTWADGAYRRLSGTSMAVPHVTGLAARYWAARPSRSAVQVRSWLAGQATKYDIADADGGGAGPGYDIAAGYGSVRSDRP